MVSGGVLKPLLFKSFELSFEVLEYVLLGKVVVVELLDYDENKEIQHHVGTDDHEGEEVDWSQITSTVHSLYTVIASVHTIFHNAIPVLACGNTKQRHHGASEVIEVSVAGYDIA